MSPLLLQTVPSCGLRVLTGQGGSCRKNPLVRPKPHPVTSFNLVSKRRQGGRWSATQLFGGRGSVRSRGRPSLSAPGGTRTQSVSMTKCWCHVSTGGQARLELTGASLCSPGSLPARGRGLGLPQRGQRDRPAPGQPGPAVSGSPRARSSGQCPAARAAPPVRLSRG